jgi:hypothetical protein
VSKNAAPPRMNGPGVARARGEAPHRPRERPAADETCNDSDRYDGDPLTQNELQDVARICPESDEHARSPRITPVLYIAGLSYGFPIRTVPQLLWECNRKCCGMHRKWEFQPVACQGEPAGRLAGVTKTICYIRKGVRCTRVPVWAVKTEIPAYCEGGNGNGFHGGFVIRSV